MSRAEEFIKKNIKDCSNQYDFPEYFENGIKRLKEYQHWITPDQAKDAVKIAREEMINEICEWIKDNIEQYPVDNWDRFVNSLITDLKQAMNDGR